MTDVPSKTDSHSQKEIKIVCGLKYHRGRCVQCRQLMLVRVGAGPSVCDDCFRPKLARPGNSHTDEPMSELRYRGG